MYVNLDAWIRYISVDCKVHFFFFFYCKVSFFGVNSSRINKILFPCVLKSNFCLLLPTCAPCFAGKALDIKVATICHSINTCKFNSAYALISNTKEAAAV